MIRNPSVNPVPSGPPVMTFNPSNLPLTHIVSLRSKLTQIIESLQALTYAIDADGRPGMSSWPEILSKYNNLLAQSHTLINALSGANIPQPARRPGEAVKERVNPFEMIALHPLISNTSNPSGSGATTAPTVATTASTSAAATSAGGGVGGLGGIDEAAHGMIENLLRTDPHPEVIKRWDETVRRFVERRKGGTRVTNEDIIKEMGTMKEDHDSRIRRALEVVEGLKDRWDWKLRVALDDPNAEEGEDEDEDLFGDREEDDEVIDVDKLIRDEDEIMATQTTSKTMLNGSMVMETSQNSLQAPPTTQQTVIEEENMFSEAEDDDDDEEFEDVMED